MLISIAVYLSILGCLFFSFRSVNKERPIVSQPEPICQGYVTGISLSGSGTMVINYHNGAHCIAYGMDYLTVSRDPQGQFILKGEKPVM